MNKMNKQYLITKKNIIDIIKKNGFIVIFEKDNAKRKTLHKLAKSKGLYHVSYVDKTKDYDKELKYWCESCRRYLDLSECATIYDGYYCGHCFEPEDICKKLVFDKNKCMYDLGYHESKWIEQNNTIIISENTNFLKDEFINAHKYIVYLYNDKDDVL